MRAYVVVNGGLFALLVAVHLARIFVEGLTPLREPAFLLATTIALAMTVWAVVVFRRLYSRRRR